MKLESSLTAGGDCEQTEFLDVLLNKLSLMTNALLKSNVQDKSNNRATQNSKCDNIVVTHLRSTGMNRSL